jgi:hypothetical protein
MPFGRLRGLVSRIVGSIVLLIGLAECEGLVGTGLGDDSALCLLNHPGDVSCCSPGYHVERTTCCPDGAHEVSDVEHEDWVICIFDEPPAGADAAPDVGTDAP